MVESCRFLIESRWTYSHYTLVKYGQITHLTNLVFTTVHGFQGTVDSLGIILKNELACVSYLFTVLKGQLSNGRESDAVCSLIHFSEGIRLPAEDIHRSHAYPVEQSLS